MARDILTPIPTRNEQVKHDFLLRGSTGPTIQQIDQVFNTRLNQKTAQSRFTTDDGGRLQIKTIFLQSPEDQRSRTVRLRSFHANLRTHQPTSLPIKSPTISQSSKLQFSLTTHLSPKWPRRPTRRNDQKPEASTFLYIVREGDGDKARYDNRC